MDIDLNEIVGLIAHASLCDECLLRRTGLGDRRLSGVLNELERLQEETRLIGAENRRLRADHLRAREDLEHERERLRYALQQVAELRAKVPDTVRQAAVPVEGPIAPCS